MATLTVFRKKVVPPDTEYGDDIHTHQGATATFVSENLSEQVVSGKYVYTTSAEFKPGSTSLYLNGIYMTIGVDYDELGDDQIIFLGEYASQSETIFSEETTLLSIKYIAK